MTTYSYYYQKGIPYYDEHVQEISEAVTKGESVCLCSAPLMGDARLIDYCLYKAKSNLGEGLSVLYDKDNSLTEWELMSWHKKTGSSNGLIILPHLPFKSKAFINRFYELMAFNTESRICIVRLFYDFLINPSEYFESSVCSRVEPFSYVKTRKPLTRAESKVAIQLRRDVHGWDIPAEYESKVRSLSGGNLGLTKVLCNYVDKHGSLDGVDILNYPPVARAVHDLKTAYERLSFGLRKTLGFVNSSGVIQGELLARSLGLSKDDSRLKLPPSLKRLLKYMISKKSEIVTLDEIDEILRGESDFALWGNYKAISRLRKAVGDQYRIENKKGRGYILIE